MNEDKFEIGNKIRFNYRGAVVEGPISSCSEDSVGIGDGGVSFRRTSMTNVVVLERAKPQDIYVPGTVVRWMDPHVQRTPYRSAHKQPDNLWYHNGSLVTWETLLNKRPLTVLTETTVLE